MWIPVTNSLWANRRTGKTMGQRDPPQTENVEKGRATLALPFHGPQSHSHLGQRDPGLWATLAHHIYIRDIYKDCF